MLTGYARDGNITKVTALLDSGADPTFADPNRLTPLMAAVSIRHVEIVRLLLDRGANPNVESSNLGYDEFPLHEAMLICFSPATKINPEAVDWQGFTILQLLLEHNAHVSVTRSADGRTPLHLAAEYGLLRVAEVLIENGSKIMPRDSSGKSPLDYATSGPMIKLLKQHGAVERP